VHPVLHLHKLHIAHCVCVCVCVCVCMCVCARSAEVRVHVLAIAGRLPDAHDMACASLHMKFIS
jgi:hypothetical protein